MKMAPIHTVEGCEAVTILAFTKLEDPGFVRQLDCQPHLLAVENGMVDLRNGLLRERQHEDMVLRVLESAYDPNANITNVEDVITDYMGGNVEMVQYLQKLLGYGITSKTHERVLPVFTGRQR